MIEGGAAHRGPVLTGEALHCSGGPDREAQEETQGRTRRCEVADDSVVVMKFWPVIAGNSLRIKPERSTAWFVGGDVSQKRHGLRREEVYSKFSGSPSGGIAEHKSPDEVGHLVGGRL